LGYILGDFFTNSSGHPGRSVGVLVQLPSQYAGSARITTEILFSSCLSENPFDAAQVFQNQFSRLKFTSNQVSFLFFEAIISN
jgi:hypothetical protein